MKEEESNDNCDDEREKNATNTCFFQGKASELNETPTPTSFSDPYLKALSIYKLQLEDLTLLLGRGAEFSSEQEERGGGGGKQQKKIGALKTTLLELIKINEIITNYLIQDSIEWKKKILKEEFAIFSHDGLFAHLTDPYHSTPITKVKWPQESTLLSRGGGGGGGGNGIKEKRKEGINNPN